MGSDPARAARKFNLIVVPAWCMNKPWPPPPAIASAACPSEQSLQVSIHVQTILGRDVRVPNLSGKGMDSDRVLSSLHMEESRTKNPRAFYERGRRIPGFPGRIPNLDAAALAGESEIWQDVGSSIRMGYAFDQSRSATCCPPVPKLFFQRGLRLNRPVAVPRALRQSFHSGGSISTTSE